MAAPLESEIKSLKSSLSDSNRRYHNIEYDLMKAQEQLQKAKEEAKAKAEQKLEEIKKKGILDSEDF